MSDPLLEEARAAAAAWAQVTGAPVLHMIRENVIFRVDTDRGPHALRLHRQGYHSDGALESELAWMGKKIEKHYGRPMDIEWAIDKDLPAGGNIFILQARPETIWSNRQQAPVSSGASAMDYIVANLIAGKKLG